MIKTTDKTSNLNKALLAAQSAMEAVKKDTTNLHFKNTYASLSSVLDAVKGPLNDNGILIMQSVVSDVMAPGGSAAAIFVTTRLTQAESGEYVEITIPIPLEQPTAQKVGSATTYGRRYGLETLLGLAEADDDGHAASDRRPANSSSRPREPAERTPDWQKVSDRMRVEIADCKDAAALLEWGMANNSTKQQMPSRVADQINQCYVARLDELEGKVDPQAPLPDPGAPRLSDLDIPERLKR